MRVGQVESFEPDWAAPGDWAAMYRAAGLQVVPSHLPSEGRTGSARRCRLEIASGRIGSGRDIRSLVRRGGEHARRPTWASLSGRASGNVFVIDLDEYKTPDALALVAGVLAEHNNGIEPETCQQVTGGGGRQLFFRAPKAGTRRPTRRL
jgi:hypothetical protein